MSVWFGLLVHIVVCLCSVGCEECAGQWTPIKWLVWWGCRVSVSVVFILVYDVQAVPSWVCVRYVVEFV